MTRRWACNKYRPHQESARARAMRKQDKVDAKVNMGEKLIHAADNGFDGRTFALAKAFRKPQMTNGKYLLDEEGETTQTGEAEANVILRHLQRIQGRNFSRTTSATIGC